MKKIIAIVLSIGCALFILGAIVIGGIIFFAFKGTQPVVDAAENEFKLVAAGKVHEAYEGMSSGYRAKMNEEAFKSQTAIYHLESFQTASWSNRNINNDKGKLDGKVVATDGIARGLVVSLVKEGSAWKVDSIWRDIAPEISETLPSSDEAQSIVTQVNNGIVESVKTSNLAPFKAQMMPELITEIKEDANLKYFQGLVPDKNAAAITDLKLTESPGWDPEGSLRIPGTMKLGAGELKFSYRFVKSEGKWMLIGYNIDTIAMAQPKSEEKTE